MLSRAGRYGQKVDGVITQLPGDGEPILCSREEGPTQGGKRPGLLRMLAGHPSRLE